MRKNGIVLIGIVLWVLKSIVQFIKKACKAGRLVELVASTILLAGSYLILAQLWESVEAWVFIIPIGVFSCYWALLFSQEKITSTEANPNWVDRKWWWGLDGWEFEAEIAKVFRLNGYNVKVTKKTGDGGIDLIMFKDGKKIIVQSKHYSSPIAVQVARELNGVKDDFKADELIIVASSGATKACLDFIKNKPYFKIIDLEDIIRMGLRPQRS